MVIKTMQLAYNTIKYLKLSQIYYQILNRLRKKEKLHNVQHPIGTYQKISFKGKVRSHSKYIGHNQFEFLNLKKNFNHKIDWDFVAFGKLWSYNLEYFDYLHQSDLSDDIKNDLIKDFYKYSVEKEKLLEPYPVSLRSINIIRYSQETNQFDVSVLKYVYQELKYLNSHCEFHLLGNHLLENAFALILGGVFFGEKRWYSNGKNILTKELHEQILKDGAHFELSPMYHSIIFFRVLELVDWYESYEEKDLEFLLFCKKIASDMRSWLECIRFDNGDIPLFNDAAKHIAYDSQFLLAYCQQLKIKSSGLCLNESGYRGFKSNSYDIKVDFAQIGATYQPGHAHADALSFILYYKGVPLFVEQGTSTYQIGARRELERSTEAHNTVVINNRNQSQVWGGFRVGKRAETIIIKDEDTSIEAMHDGYRDIGVFHTRAYNFNDDNLSIKDTIEGKANSAKAFFHIYPGNQPEIFGNTVVIGGNIICEFNQYDSIAIELYQYSDSYNEYNEARRIVVEFKKVLSTNITFNT